MLIISHRGNLAGRIPEKENHPDYIKEAIDNGFYVEIDVRFIDGCWYLGHDKPDYKIYWDFLNKNSNKLFIHAKTIETLNALIQKDLNRNFVNKIFCNKLHYFFHDQDDCTLTSQRYIWTYPNHKNRLTKQCIAVMPEQIDLWSNLMNCYGICTDYPIIVPVVKNEKQFSEMIHYYRNNKF